MKITRGKPAESRMGTQRVIKALDIPEDVRLGLSAGGVVVEMDELALEAAEEILSCGVVVGIALAGHALADVSGGECPLPDLTDTKTIDITERERGKTMGNKKGTPPPRYDEAFKAGAVRLVTEQGRPSREVASELGICIDTLRSWLKAAGAPSLGQADRQSREARRTRELKAEVRALRKQLAEKEEVIDVLKKSVGILSKP